MDRTKTGALIAAARKEQNMTQKELAAALHVSDRAVSKWERGAGFPDISLLEPLADTLGLGVLDLLRGERGTVPEPEPTIRQALAFLARQAKERTRRKWSQVLGGFADGGLCPLCNSGPGRGVPSGDLFGSAGHRI